MDKLTTLGLPISSNGNNCIFGKNYLCVTLPPHNNPMAIIATSRIPRRTIPVMLADSGTASCPGVAEGEAEPADRVAVGEATEAACAPVKTSVVPTRKDRTRRMTKKNANSLGMCTGFMRGKYIMGRSGHLV
jgi:hypothetical protein